jgi:polyphosphate kinase
MSSVPRPAGRRRGKSLPAPALVEPHAAPPPSQLDDPRLYLNRELSLLAFQRRVLEEAQDAGNPLLERVKFLAILGSNLDEFFMVRVSALKHQVEAGILEVGPDAMPPASQLQAIRAVASELFRDARLCWQNELMPALAKQGIKILDYAALNDAQRAEADASFHETIYPVLTPLAVDPGRPFPHISNLSLNLAIQVRGRDGAVRFARLKVPDTLPQLIPVEAGARRPYGRLSNPRYCLVWIEQVITAHLATLFPGMEILAAHPFHVTRDADIEIQELEAADLLETIEEGVRQRRFGMVVRLKISEEMPEDILDFLVQNLEIDHEDIYRVASPIWLSRLWKLASVDRPDLKEHPFVPALPAALEAKDEEDIFALIRRQNILLHHPFDSFQPVVDFLKKAAADPDVLAIKMTLYRIGRNSPVVEALLEAMENGKQVAVLVELKARFDEESNIEWARALEREGVHVVYGLVGLKIHSKIALVVRREGKAIRRYVHLATGNYNPVTAHLYTDLGYFTCDEQIGADATDLFNYLTGYSAKREYRRLLVAPVNLRRRLEELIHREILRQRNGEAGHLIFKMNALADQGIIRLLYEASQAGVKIDLLVRGICCLRPGLPGISENIRVTSIVGRFLEHSRIYYFRNGGQEEVYVGSADLMHRNISRRVEVVFPVEDPALIRHLRDEVLSVYMADNVKARLMLPDGSYARVQPAPGEKALNSQEWFLSRHKRTD